MTRGLTRLSQLGPRFWDYRGCIRTRHFLARPDERGFDERLLPELWEHGEWSANDRGLVVSKHLPGVGIWELVIGVDDNFTTSRFVTIWLHGHQAYVQTAG